MKHSWLVLPALLALAIATVSVMAQDPVKVGPDVYKCTFENARIRVCEITFKPGAKIGMHSHPDHAVYLLSSGKLLITNADGKPTELVAKPGDVAWIPAEAHRAENVGGTEVRAIVFELKPAGK